VRRAFAAAGAALATALLAGVASADAALEKEHADRAGKALRQDAAELRRVAEWGDRNGLERTADSDWERCLAWLLEARAPETDLEAVRKRLRFVRRGGEWVRDAASWTLESSVPNARPERGSAYEERRAEQFARPASRRRRDLATWCRGQGLAAHADRHVARALALDPVDPWAHLAAGDLPDGDGGWMPVPSRERAAADRRAEALARRLRERRAEPLRLDEASSRSSAAGRPLSVWALRSWRLETDLDDEAATAALAAADLAERWFRATFEVEPDARLLPAGGVFVVVTSADTYRRVVDAIPGLSSAERRFAAGLGAFPVPRAKDDAPAEVVIERPDGPFAADACLHYAVHFLAQARFGVEPKDAWLYEGLAAYATRRLTSLHATWCVRLEETGGKTAGLEPAQTETWPQVAEAMAARGDDFPLRGVVGASLNGLDGTMLVKSWSLLRWLLEERLEEGRMLFAAKGAGSSSEEALRIATGLSIEALDAAWRDHVRGLGGE
jgi:hypothetical protein